MQHIILPYVRKKRQLVGAQWLISLYDYLKEHETVVVNGFKSAGVLSL